MLIVRGVKVVIKVGTMVNYIYGCHHDLSYAYKLAEDPLSATIVEQSFNPNDNTNRLVAEKGITEEEG